MTDWNHGVTFYKKRKLTFIEPGTVSHFPLLKNIILIVSYEVDNIHAILQIRTLRVTVKHLAHCHPAVGYAFGPDSKASPGSLPTHQLPLRSANKSQQDGTSADHQTLAFCNWFKFFHTSARNKFQKSDSPSQINAALCPFLLRGGGGLSNEMLKINPVTGVAVSLLLWELFWYLPFNFALA